MEVRALFSQLSCLDRFHLVIIYKFLATNMLLQLWEQVMDHLVTHQWIQRVLALSWLVNYVRGCTPTCMSFVLLTQVICKNNLCTGYVYTMGDHERRFKRCSNPRLNR